MLWCRSPTGHKENLSSHGVLPPPLTFVFPLFFSLFLFPLPLSMWCFLPLLKYIFPEAPLSLLSCALGSLKPSGIGCVQQEDSLSLFSQKPAKWIYLQKKDTGKRIYFVNKYLLKAVLFFSAFLQLKFLVEFLDRKEPELKFIFNVFSQYLQKQRKWVASFPACYSFW